MLLKCIEIALIQTIKDKLKKRADAEWLYPHCLQILSDLYSKFLRKSRPTPIPKKVEIGSTRIKKYNQRT